MFLITLAQAQEATQTAAAAMPQQSPFMSFMPLILIFAVMYFLMIRPQKKRMEQEKQFINQLKKGDEVYTKSGVLGTISGLTDKVATLDVGDGIKIKVLRSQIGGTTQSIFSTAATTAPAKS